MKRTMRFFARLYPSSWRKRYGDEFEALLEDTTPSACDACDVFWGALRMQMTTWSFGRITLACSVAGILVAVAVSFALPVHYLSRAVLTVTPADGSIPAGESTRRLVTNMEQNVFSRESLTSILQEHNLYPGERALMPVDDVIDNMKRNIRVDPVTLASPGNPDTLTFVLQFEYSDRYVAQRVNAELASRFLEGALNSQLNSNWIFHVSDPPSLPVRPAVPNRTRLGAVGLFAGLLAGLTLANVVRSRPGRTFGNG